MKLSKAACVGFLEDEAVPRTVYPCKEFEPVDVPLDRLIRNGKVQIYPQAEKYFDLDYRDGRLVVAPKSYVGLIPINDDVAIHVVPRFPIANLFYLLQHSNAALHFLEGHLRSYDLERGDWTDPISLLAERMAAMCNVTLRGGLLRRYVSVDDVSGGHGTLNLSQTVARYRSRGIQYRQSWESTEHSTQLRENQLIKLALHRVVAFYAESQSPNLGHLRMIRDCLFMFDGVAVPHSGFRFDETDLASMVNRLPALHRDYAGLLWVAFLLHAQRGISIEALGPAVFDTFLVNLADIFEDYVRLLIQRSIASIIPTAKALDGNVHQVPLFVHGAAHLVKPDIYIVAAGKTVAVLDAKYKPRMKASDRYEVLAFCEALQVKKAVIISPSAVEAEAELLGTTAGKVELHYVKINLNSNNMPEAEALFMKRIASMIT